MVCDPFYAESHVFVTDARKESIFQALDCTADGREPDIAEVWTSPEPPSLAGGALKNGEYNPSLSFPSSDNALFTDGRGTLYILRTGNRSKFGNPWGIAFKDEVCGKDQPFSIISSCLNNKVLHCILQHVEEKDKVLCDKKQKVEPKVNFVNVLEWMTFIEMDDGWSLDRVRRMAFYGSIDYLELNQKIEASEQCSDASLLCVTEKPFEMIYDSAGAIPEDESDVKPDEISNDDKKVFLFNCKHII